MVSWLEFAVIQGQSESRRASELLAHPVVNQNRSSYKRRHLPIRRSAPRNALDHSDGYLL